MTKHEPEYNYQTQSTLLVVPTWRVVYLVLKEIIAYPYQCKVICWFNTSNIPSDTPLHFGG